MAEYIDRLKVLKEMHCSHTLPFFIGHRTDEDIMFCQMRDIVQEQPTADVVEVVHGRWVEIQKYDIFECSECGYEWYVHGIARVHPLDNSAHYCPDCGAKMDGEKNG